MFIVYFEKRHGHHYGGLCLNTGYYPKHANESVNSCYFCPAKSCTIYSDGERRVVVDGSTLDKMRENPRIKIIKIIKER